MRISRMKIGRGKPLTPRIHKERIISTKEQKDKGRFNDYVKRAIKRGNDTILTYQEWQSYIDQPCFYCGGVSTNLDRIDSLKNYSLDNIQPCCGMCNMMKFNYDQTKYINHMVKIYKNLKSTKII